MMETKTTDDWASTRASWWKLLFAIAGALHAIADNIEARVELAIEKRKLKDLYDGN